MGDLTETSMSKFPDIIELNVGGCTYSTTLLTLTKKTDTMLAAMFSGKYDVQKDQNGRYFIDADGEMFCHILRYLRYDELPPTSLCEKVYNDAHYFGIDDLVEELEKRPPLIGKKIRERLRTRINGYEEFVNDLIQKSTNINQVETSTQISSVTVLLYAKSESTDYSQYDINHQCFLQASETGNAKSGSTTKAQVEMGPWCPDLDADSLMKILIQDLEEKQFVCNYTINGPCLYKCTIPRILRASYGGVRHIKCSKHFYTVNFHWSKM